MNHIPIPISNKNNDNDNVYYNNDNCINKNDNDDCQRQRKQMNIYDEENDTILSLFPNVLPQHRQGQRHDTIDSYHAAIQYNDNNKNSNKKLYTLVLVTVPNDTEHTVPMTSSSSSPSSSPSINNNNNTIGGSILLGLKQRGFGKGFYNSFGGKIEPYELQQEQQEGEQNQEPMTNNDKNDNNATVVPTAGTCSKYNASVSAAREVVEETGIVVPIDTMLQSYLGILNFTFDKDDQTDINSDTDNTITEMIVHLFLVKCCYLTDTNESNTTTTNINNYLVIDPTMIRGCEEITTEWYTDWYTIPLQQMFIDDNIWLTRILLYYNTIQSINGSFHFASGGTQTNTINHYYLSMTTNDSTNNNNDNDINNNQVQKVTLDGDVLDNNTNTGITNNTIPYCQVISPPANNNRNNNNVETTAAATTTTGTCSTPMSLERHLFHTLHNNKIRSPTIKEFKECYEFCKVVKSFYITNNYAKKKNSTHTGSNATKHNNNNNNNNNNNSVKVVIDVAGGHGALGALLLITIPTVEKCIVIDPAIITNGKHGIQSAWGHLFDTTKLQYQHECLRTALPCLLQSLLVLKETDTTSTTTTDRAGFCNNENKNNIKTTATNNITHEQPEVTATTTTNVAAAHCSSSSSSSSSTSTTKLYPNEILVVACHACQHLSDETIEICSKYNVHVAVLPCCQKDITNGNQWKQFCSNISTEKNSTTSSNSSSSDTTTTGRRQLLPVVQQQQNISIATTMDLLLAGKAMSWLTPYTDVRIKIINEKITPQNRLILCRSSYSSSSSSSDNNCNTTTASLLTTINSNKNDKISKQHQRLQVAYNRAHMVQPVPVLVKSNKKRATTTSTSTVLKTLTAKNNNIPMQKCKRDSTRTVILSGQKQQKQIHDKNFSNVLAIMLVGFIFGIGTTILFPLLSPLSLLSFACTDAINSSQQTAIGVIIGIIISNIGTALWTRCKL